MSNREIAIQYLQGFAAGDPDTIKRVLSAGFTFRGPFYSCNTAADYLAMLESDPPDKSSFTITSIFDNDDKVCIIYQFAKTGVTVDMAQVFTFESGKIAKSILIFDGRQFT